MERPDTVLTETQTGRTGYAPRPRGRFRPLLTFFAVLSLIIAAAVIAGVLPRLKREQTLQAAATSEQAQRPVVNATAARQAATDSALELPGELQALVESPVFARADGYVVKRFADYGDHVKAGQSLAEIETPELDQQIQQARATISNSQSALKESQAALTLAEANLSLAQKTAARWGELEKHGAVSHQETDEKRADLEVKRAQVEAARAHIVSGEDLVHANEANLRRLQEMKTFARVTAPFDRIITARNVDIGFLINSGNGGPARELFRIAQTGTMRIFVNVPQVYVGAIRAGDKAELHVQERPGELFPATVTRFSNEVDSNSRSMLAILEIPNPKGVLVPGMYATVRFATKRTAPAVLIPGDALVLGTQGTRVAIAGPGGRVQFRAIKVGNDLGTEVEVLSGLAPGELVIVNPTDAIRDGVLVDVKR